MTQRIAVLVDGDNLSPAHAARIMAEAEKLGRVDVARVYGNANHPSDWMTAPGYRMIHAGCGKNAADVLLCIDAMELAMGGDWQGFVIASSDGDFVHLAQRLRERGLTVAGIGEAKAPPTFRSACASFVTIGTTESKASAAPQPRGSTSHGPKDARQTTSATVHPVGKIDGQIRDILGIAHGDARGMTLQQLSVAMSHRHQFRISGQPEKSWRAYLKARPALYVMRGQGAEVRVAINMQGIASQSARRPIAAE